MHTATYCPEDNKLRLYVGRVPRDEYEQLRNAGFKSTPKQDCDFVATWSPSREDLIRELYLDDDDDIGDEDYSPQERAADRAERFSDYRDKRRSEATGHADTFDNGPQAFGHQNQRRAERQAARHDRHRTRAVSQWSKAEYWQERTAGVISHSLYKSKPSVRRARIVKLMAELRRLGSSERWESHLKMRLIYENAMLENEGGAAFNDEIEVGYVAGRYQVTKVNKSQADGRVVSVNVVDTTTWEEGRRINIERMKSGQFSPPSDEQAKAFDAYQKEQKAKAKAKNAAKPKLINPTPEDAKKLQELVFNAQYKDDSKHSETINATQKAYSSQTGSYGKCETVVIGEKMRPMKNHGWTTNKNTQRRGAFKVRVCHNGWNADRVVVITDKPQKPIPWDRIEELRAKEPTPKSIGRDFARLWNKRDQWGYSFGDLPEDEREAAKQLRQDAGYLGWAKIECSNQFDLTDEGRQALEHWRRVVEQEEAAPSGMLF